MSEIMTIDPIILTKELLGRIAKPGDNFDVWNRRCPIVWYSKYCPGGSFTTVAALWIEDDVIIAIRLYPENDRRGIDKFPIHKYDMRDPDSFDKATGLLDKHVHSCQADRSPPVWRSASANDKPVIRVSDY